jgi:uncharacterized protein YecE (DUF72 family)
MPPSDLRAAPAEKPAGPPTLRLGTSSWACEDWVGPFYPRGCPPRDFLRHYAEQFDTVECDATFYRVPSPRTVDSWREKTPEGFLFSAKLPREITHDRGLVDCRKETADFLAVLDRLGERLGPILAQFPYVAKAADPEEHATGADFLRRLQRFLEAWPRERKLAVEVRNATWIRPPLLDLLRDHGAALALTAYYTMPGPEKLFLGPDPQTTDWLYVRFIGDHKRMDELVARERAEGRREADWSSVVVDRTAEMARWARWLKKRAARDPGVLVYFNNHYAGFAPGSARLYRKLWDES